VSQSGRRTKRAPGDRDLSSPIITNGCPIRKLGLR
jgi:hypothetical protein